MPEEMHSPDDTIDRDYSGFSAPITGEVAPTEKMEGVSKEVARKNILKRVQDRARGLIGEGGLAARKRYADEVCELFVGEEIGDAHTEREIKWVENGLMSQLERDSISLPPLQNLIGVKGTGEGMLDSITGGKLGVVGKTTYRGYGHNREADEIAVKFFKRHLGTINFILASRRVLGEKASRAMGPVCEGLDWVVDYLSGCQYQYRHIAEERARGHDHLEKTGEKIMTGFIVREGGPIVYAPGRDIAGNKEFTAEGEREAARYVEFCKKAKTIAGFV